MVSIDESDFPTTGFRGMSLRLYNPSKDEWAIYWINSSDGVLQPPVFGRFDNGIGVFTGEDMDGDRRILVRFEWSGTDGPTPRWCQSFSYDDGASWEDNWVMDFSRPS